MCVVPIHFKIFLTIFEISTTKLPVGHFWRTLWGSERLTIKNYKKKLYAYIQQSPYCIGLLILALCKW